jgi:hypothetical protein
MGRAGYRKGYCTVTNVIKHYIDKGVLNYVDHETPRNYFLYDGVIDEQPANVHRLVEDLCHENMAQAKVIKSLQKLLEFYEVK